MVLCEPAEPARSWSARQRRLNPLGCGRLLRWEILAASLTILVSWSASRSITGAARDLDRRAALRQPCLEDLGLLRTRLQRAGRRSSETAELAVGAIPRHWDDLFSGKQVVVREQAGARLLVLSPVAGEDDGQR